jgi:sulfoxide reductase heme-binding subunit YedZ
MVTHQLFWIASRAFGTIAMILLGTTVAVGLTMSAKIMRRPGLTPRLRRFHEAAALVTLGLIAVHGGLLLFDQYLRPGLTGIAIPFVMGYRNLFTGLGIIAGWLTMVFAISFYLRKRIGARTWRKLHRFTVVAYFLALFHVLGSGTDVATPWMALTLAGLTAPVGFGLAYRILDVGPRQQPDGRTSRRTLARRRNNLATQG